MKKLFIVLALTLPLTLMAQEAKEEVKELERLLLEAKERLDDEYIRRGGRSWWEKF